MAQNITIMGASYSDVPAVTLPKTGGGTAKFTDVSDTTALANTVLSGNYFYDEDGVKVQGTLTGLSYNSMTVSLVVANWSSKTQTVTATGVTSSSDVIVSPAPSDMDNYVAAGIKCTAQAANSLTFTCTTEPTSAIDVNVVSIA